MNMKESNKVLLLVQAAMIAALYVVLTFIANALGLASSAIQVRFSEALTILPYFTPAAVPGLFIGCLLSNILTGCAMPDIIFGSLATLVGALFTGKIRKDQNPRRKLTGSQSCSAASCGGFDSRGIRQMDADASARLIARGNKWMAPIPPIVSNAIIIPFVLLFAYGIKPLWFSFITVTIGEVISCGVLGMLLLFALQKYAGRLFTESES